MGSLIKNEVLYGKRRKIFRNEIIRTPNSGRFWRKDSVQFAHVVCSLPNAEILKKFMHLQPNRPVRITLTFKVEFNLTKILTWYRVYPKFAYLLIRDYEAFAIYIFHTSNVYP